MKAAVCKQYGPPDVLNLTQLETPKPKDSEILIKNFAAAVNSGDCRIRGFVCPAWAWIPMRLILGITKPRRPVLGMMFSGIVEETGKNVSRFKKGDFIYGSAGMRMGAYAEYICLPENSVLALKPKNISHEEAAAVPFGGMTAMHFLRRGGIEKGQKVLVYGASGSVGTSALQLAKYFGAEVTSVCSGPNAEFVKSLGSDKVIDYAVENFTEKNEKYDLIFDAVGKIKKADCRTVMKEGGKFVTVGGLEVSKERSEDLDTLRELIESGKLKPVVDRIYPLEEISSAHAYADTGRKKGNVVIRINH